MQKDWQNPCFEEIILKKYPLQISPDRDFFSKEKCKVDSIFQNKKTELIIFSS